MKKATAGWLIAAIVLIVLGCILLGVVMMKLNWNFAKLSTTTYEENTYHVTEPYRHISIKTNTSHVMFVPTDDKQTTISCLEPQNAKHAVCVNGDTLTVELIDTRQWYEHITLVNFNTPKIVVMLPVGAYGNLAVTGDTGDVQIPPQWSFDSIDVAVHTGNVQLEASAVGVASVETTTGHITANHLTATSLNLTASTGRITANGITCKGNVAAHVSTGKALLSDIVCRNLESVGSTGDLTLTNVVASSSFSLKRGTGDITFDGADAVKITAHTSTGDVTGRLLSNKTFSTSTSTGQTNVPPAGGGGRCEIKTSTGDIRITIEE